MSVSILVVGLTIFLAHFFVVLFKKTKIPDVLLLMLGGIVAGPVLGLIRPSDFGIVGPVVSSIALIVILFEGGINLKLKTIVSAIGQTTVITLFSWVLSAALVAVVMHLLTPIGWGLSIMTGAILAGTSSAVVVPMISMLGVSEKPRTVMFLESALTDVLCIVVTMGIAQALARGNMDTGRMLGQIGLSFGVAMIIGLAGAVVWALLLGWVRQFPNTIFSTVAYVFVLYGVAEAFELSGAITALAFGVTLANISGVSLTSSSGKKTLIFKEVSDIDRLFFSEVVFLLKTFFFIYLGISIRFDKISYIFIALLMVALIYAMRFALVRLLASRTFPRKDASLMTIMVPKGLAAAVLALLPKQLGLPGAEWVAGVVFPVVLISIVLTSLLGMLLDKSPLGSVYDRIFATFAPSPPSSPHQTFEEASGQDFALAAPGEPEGIVIEDIGDNSPQLPDNPSRTTTS